MEPLTAMPTLADVLTQLAQALVTTAAPAPQPEPQPVSHRVLVSVDEAAERLGIGRTSAWRLVRTGDLESVRIGRLRRVRVDAIQDYANRLAAKEVA